MKMIMAFGGNDLKIPIYFFSEEKEEEVKNLVDYFNKIENFTKEEVLNEIEKNISQIKYLPKEMETEKVSKYSLIEILQTNFLGNHFLVRNPYMAYIYKLEIQDIPINQKFLEIDLD